MVKKPVGKPATSLKDRPAWVGTGASGKPSADKPFTRDSMAADFRRVTHKPGPGPAAAAAGPSAKLKLEEAKPRSARSYAAPWEYTAPKASSGAAVAATPEPASRRVSIQQSATKATNAARRPSTASKLDRRRSSAAPQETTDSRDPLDMSLPYEFELPGDKTPRGSPGRWRETDAWSLSGEKDPEDGPTPRSPQLVRQTAVAAAQSFLNSTRMDAGGPAAGSSAASPTRPVEETVDSLTEAWVKKMQRANSGIDQRRSMFQQRLNLVERRRAAAEGRLRRTEEDTRFHETLTEERMVAIKKVEAEKHALVEELQSLERSRIGLLDSSLNGRKSLASASRWRSPHLQTSSVAADTSLNVTTTLEERHATASRLLSELEGQLKLNAESILSLRAERDNLQNTVSREVDDVSRLKRSATNVQSALEAASKQLSNANYHREMIPRLQDAAKANADRVSELKKSTAVATDWFMKTIDSDDAKVRMLQAVDSSAKNVMTLTPSFVREIKEETETFGNTFHRVVRESEAERHSLERENRVLMDKLAEVEDQIGKLTALKKQAALAA